MSELKRVTVRVDHKYGAYESKESPLSPDRVAALQARFQELIVEQWEEDAKARKASSDT